MRVSDDEARRCRDLLRIYRDRARHDGWVRVTAKSMEVAVDAISDLLEERVSQVEAAPIDPAVLAFWEESK